MTSVLQTLQCKKHKIVKLVGGYDLCVHCGECKNTVPEVKIPLRPLHYIILQEIFELYPRYMLKNQNCFFYSEMWRYAWEKKVFRVTIMGETRGGKSEIAQTVAMNWAVIFNALYDEGHYKNVDIVYGDGTKMSIGKITIDATFIHSNQSNYLYYLRDNTRDRKLLFGQMHIIDEERDNPGGIGSFSEEMEIENLNNIVAKFMQCEIWITPKRFQIMNTPYGLNCMIKDEAHRTNWSLLYKLEMNSGGLREQNFMGWVGLRLHDDKKLREEYQQKKNHWIEQELKGTINERAQRRLFAINKMLEDETFVAHKIGKDGQVKWNNGIESMKFLVEDAMMRQVIDQFNDTEIERIVHGARALGEKRAKEGLL